MSNNITRHATQGDVALSLIMKKLTYGRGGWVSQMKRRVWIVDGNAPAVDNGSQATYPIQTGDFVWRVASEYVYICTVAPSATTAATFVKMHA